jgi:hypothetical protein
VALFRIEQQSTYGVLEMLSNKLPLGTNVFPGMLDFNKFKAQFSGNSYQNCQNFHRGSVFFVANGGQVVDQ